MPMGEQGEGTRPCCQMGGWLGRDAQGMFTRCVYKLVCITVHFAAPVRSGLSRRRQGFKSPWGRQQEIKAPVYCRCLFSCLCCGTRIRRCRNLSRRGVPAKAATPLFASTHYIFCLYIRQPASTENSIHENGLSAISGIHIPAYSPLPGICSARIYSSIPHNFRTSFCGRLVSRVTSL